MGLGHGRDSSGAVVHVKEAITLITSSVCNTIGAMASEGREKRSPLKSDLSLLESLSLAFFCSCYASRKGLMRANLASGGRRLISETTTV